jgi:hypothetical protein
MQLFRCQHRGQYISTRNYEITAVISWRRFIFMDCNLKTVPYICNFSIFNCIFVFWIHVKLVGDSG